MLNFRTNVISTVLSEPFLSSFQLHPLGRKIKVIGEPEEQII